MTIGEVLREAWARLIRKQWLIVYPLALAVIQTLAFLAVYTASGEPLRWNAFFTANFERWSYVRESFLTGFSFTPTLAIAIFAGLAVCVLSAMIRAPFFRAEPPDAGPFSTLSAAAGSTLIRSTRALATDVWWLNSPALIFPT